MPEKLILLSDLWGDQNKEWLTYYLDFLNPHFNIEFWDVCALAGFAQTNASQEERHRFFVDIGIKNAIAQCLQKTKSPVNVLAFSIGGTIAWQASLQGWPVQKLYAISATRLRHETQSLNLPVKLIYGDQDFFRPDLDWLQSTKAQSRIIAGANHELYRQKEIIDLLQSDLLHFLRK